MLSTVDRKMWSNETKLSYTSKSDKPQRPVEPRMPGVRRDPLLSFKQGDPLRDSSVTTFPKKKPRQVVSSSISAKFPTKPRDRFGVRKSSDVLKVSESEMVRRRARKPKKDAKPFPGKIYREKTFGVFSTPTVSAPDRPSNVPRRRMQADEVDTVDRGYVSDVKSEISRSFYHEKEDEFKLDRRIRPKSAGQALYHADSDDDSSLDGEIEVIDIDNDDTFFVIEDTERQTDDVTEGDLKGKPSQMRKKSLDNTNRYYGNSDNTNQQHVYQFTVSESEKRDGRGQLENNIPNYASMDTLSPASFDRRRVKSDSSVAPLQDNFIEKRRDSETLQLDKEGSRFIKKSNSVNNRQKSTLKADTSHLEIPSDKTYARAVENVLTKYSHMTVRNSTDTGRYGGRSGDNHLSHRASLPRKLKPLLNREKLGQNNQDKSDVIDQQDLFNKNITS